MQRKQAHVKNAIFVTHPQCVKEERGYWKLKEEPLDRTLWKSRSERGHEPAVTHMAGRMDEF